MREHKVTPIKNGTVIDHIPSGRALDVLNILGIGRNTGSTVIPLIHVPSKTYGFKDLVKIEDRELTPDELNKIGVIAPNAKYSIIRNYAVFEKRKVKIPDTLVDILRCGNSGCTTNSGTEWSKEGLDGKSLGTKEPVKYRIERRVVDGEVSYECFYCERTLEGDLAQYLL